MQLHQFLVFTHMTRRSCWCTKQFQNITQVLKNNRIKFPKDFFRCFSLHQHGRRTSRENRELYQMHGHLMFNPGRVGWLPMIIFVTVSYFVTIIYNDFKKQNRKLEFYLQTNLSMCISSWQQRLHVFRNSTLRRMLEQCRCCQSLSYVWSQQ